jgi:uncharacterized protein YyaL (SSP411 family)
MKNLLSEEPSLYLQQHSKQPVNWMPWGKEAFELAHKADKPLIVSIGYSACHWCNVMSKESFEDTYIASIMNRHFICIKVDREERPDIDQTYLEAVRMFNQSAGWPLNVFCLPDGRPFWGGTYFPNQDNGQGIVPWPQVLMRISDHFKKERQELDENASNVVKNLIHANNALSSVESEWSNELLLLSAKNICESHDDKNGGFTPAPKFPSPMKIDFLLAIRESQSIRTNQKLAHQIDHSIKTTLSKMGNGGIYDQIGGGFFRYSIDEKWHTPHFEKMLYDNALLLSSYSRAYQRFKSPIYKEKVEQTIHWLIRTMTDEDGGFFSSINADNEKGEGEYYFWEYEELEKVLEKDDFQKFVDAYWVSESGSLENGKSLPILKNDSQNDSVSFEGIKKTLLKNRNERPKPSRDKKKITSWNALLVSGFVDAARAFDRKEWAQLAYELNKWMTKNLISKEGDICSILFENKNLSSHAYLDDYAFWAEAILNLSSISESIISGSSKELISDAEKITLFALEKFNDPKLCGFFFNEDGNNKPAQVRKKFWYDNATPSANSSLLNVFSSLYLLTEKESWLKEYQVLRAGYPNLTRQAPHGIGHALRAISEYEIGKCKITCSPNQVEEIMSEIAKKPYRMIFISTGKKTETDLTLQVGNDFKEKIKLPKDCVKKIFS